MLAIMCGVCSAICSQSEGLFKSGPSFLSQSTEYFSISEIQISPSDTTVEANKLKLVLFHGCLQAYMSGGTKNNVLQIQENSYKY